VNYVFSGGKYGIFSAKEKGRQEFFCPETATLWRRFD
jgi:hypothetical protein